MSLPFMNLHGFVDGQMNGWLEACRLFTIDWPTNKFRTAQGNCTHHFLGLGKVLGTVQKKIMERLGKVVGNAINNSPKECAKTSVPHA